jgi:hypothetical protein
MKPFDLEKALAGEPVVTRCGFKVQELHLFKNKVSNPLVGIINNEIYAWNEEGKGMSMFKEELDLFMAPKNVKRYIYVEKFSLPFGRNTQRTAYTKAFINKNDLIRKFNLKEEDILEIEIEVDE